MPTASGMVSRLLGRPRIERPPCPIQTDNSFYTFATSVDKRDPIPLRLLTLVLDAVKLIPTEIELSDLARRDKMPDWFMVWPGEHYFLLAALVLKLQPKIVIEIGTDKGLSSLAMKKYLPAGGKVVTYDIKAWKEVPDHVLRDDDFADGRLEQRLVDLSDPIQIRGQRDLLESADFFFIDAPKDNVFEYRLMEQFKLLNFKRNPILLFDDTKLTSMLPFWEQLPHPKLDISSFGHWSGTGLVEWKRP
jgi:predicted O-methyltransferase YrrM